MLNVGEDVPDRLVKKCKKYLELLELNEWQVELKVHDSPGGEEDWEGACTFNQSTLCAKIEISRQILGDKDKSEATLFHEVVHVLMAPIQDVYWRLVQLLEQDEKKRDVYERWCDDATERIVRKIENTLYKKIDG